MAKIKAFNLDAVYNYQSKLKNWRNYATLNKVPSQCLHCKKTKAHKTILLDNGMHVCWYCWIHKETKFKAVRKPVEMIKTKHSKVITKKSKAKKVDEKIQSVSATKSNQLVPIKKPTLVDPTKTKAQGTSNIVLRKPNPIVVTESQAKEIVEFVPGQHIPSFEKCTYNSRCQCTHCQALRQIKTPLKQKYFRLTQQSQKEKFSLFETTSKVERGICSFDPKANYAIEMLDICKSFLNGKVIANDGIDLHVRQNEVHAIIGENGAGKSTLMSILFGIYTPDKGIIKVNGEQVFFSSAKDASKAGLGMVHQHFQLVPTYTVLQNVLLGSEILDPRFKMLGVLDMKAAKEKIQGLIDAYKLNINLNEKISKLTVGEQQKTEILKLLYLDASILIFDEPTAVLSPDEIEQFLKMVLDLKKDGKTIIIITHKFNEIKSIAERATVIRLGTFISDFNIKDKSIDEMATEMVGHEVVEVVNTDHNFDDRVILEIKDLVLKQQPKGANPINLKVHAGEVFAIAGVSGNGQSELVMAISGLDKRTKGTITLDGIDVTDASIAKRNELGLSHVPESRQRHGLILDLPIYMNTVSNQITKQPFSKFGLINDKEVREYARALIKKFDVRGTTRGTAEARGLSGGNQQKLIVARELSHASKLIIMMQPTRGLDLGAVKFIHEKILEEKRNGNAILLVSYELDEILSLADTIAVMNSGSLVAVGDTNIMTRNKIGQIMAGKE